MTDHLTSRLLTRSGARPTGAGHCQAVFPLGLAALVTVVLLALLLSGCSVVVQRVEPSGISQQLLVRSLERAVADLDVSRFSGRPLNLEVFSQAGPQPFVKEFVAARLAERGVPLSPGSKEDRTLKVFVSVLGTDQGATLVGLPETSAVGVGIPEIALFKWERNRGQAEVRAFAFDAKTGALLATTPTGLGRAKYDNYKVLLVIGFTVSDVNDRSP